MSALGWAALASAVGQSLHIAEASIAFFAIVISEILGWLLVADINDRGSTRHRSLDWEDAIVRLLLRWIFLAIGLLALVNFELTGFLQHYPYALICILGLSLVIALVRIFLVFGVAQRLQIWMIAECRLIVLAACVISFVQLGLLTADIVLSVTFGIYLLILMIVWANATLPKDAATSCDPSYNQLEAGLAHAMPFLFRYADIIILCWIMPPVPAFSYLLARGLSEIVFCVLKQLGDRVTPTLALTLARGRHRDFVAAAARTNLGFLLIGGAASLTVLGVGNYLPGFFGLDPDRFLDVLFWVTMAQAAPVFFGATALVMRVADSRRDIILVSLAGTLAICGAVVILGPSTPKEMAQIYAQSQLTIGAISAIIVGTKFGVWPGLTALFFRQIKLL